MQSKLKVGDLVRSTDYQKEGKAYGLILERCGYAHDQYYKVLFSCYNQPYTFRQDELESVNAK